MDLIISKAWLSALFKNVSYIFVILLGFNPHSYAILAMFMVIDTATGITRSGTIHGWRSVTSHALSVGVLAKCFLILVPLLIATAGHAVGLELKTVAVSVLNIMILSELYSILANIQSIRSGKDVAEFDVVNYMLTRLRDTIERFIKKPDNE